MNEKSPSSYNEGTKMIEIIGQFTESCIKRIKKDSTSRLTQETFFFIVPLKVGFYSLRYLLIYLFLQIYLLNESKLKIKMHSFCLS